MSLYTTVEHNTAQNSSDYFPLNFQTIIVAQILSTGGEGRKYSPETQKYYSTK